MTQVGGVVSKMGSNADMLKVSAGVAAEQATANVQAVAGATEELRTQVEGFLGRIAAL